MADIGIRPDMTATGVNGIGALRQPQKAAGMTARTRVARCWRTLVIAAIVTLTPAGLLTSPPHARADTVAYLINVTVRPGYNFANADHALSYGYGICGKVSGGRGYAEVMNDVKADFGTSDQFHASYLIAQSVNELCPQHIWQLRNSAAHYQPSVH
jgi:uncharacterized protein DUF732